jgi:hypothetical protein
MHLLLVGNVAAIQQHGTRQARCDKQGNSSKKTFDHPSLSLVVNDAD